MQSNKYAGTVLVLLLFAVSASAELPRMKMRVKWSYSMGTSVGDSALLDVNGDGKSEIFVGLDNNTVIVLDRFGKKVGDFVIGNASQIGRIYSMDKADVDGDGKDELIFGLGGARETRTYTPQDFKVSESGITPKDKVLYRVIRNHGGVYVMKPDGRPVWRYLTADSVKAVSWFAKPEGGGYITAGVGDLVIYIFNERTGESYLGEFCYDEDVTDEESGWATKGDCLDPDKCCYDLKDCSCWWDDSLINPGDPDSQTVDICFRSYTRTVCEENVEDGIIGWRYVEYKQTNGTVLLINESGGVEAHYNVRLVNDDGYPVDADNTIRDLFAGDLGGDDLNELLVTSNNGEVVILNMSNISNIRVGWRGRESFRKDDDTGKIDWGKGDAIRRVCAGDLDNNELMEVTTGSNTGFIIAYDSNGELLWRQRVDDAVTDIEMEDVESDGNRDIVVSARDGNIYVYSSNGNLKWSYFVGESLYGIDIIDIDDNGLSDIIGYTTVNTTRFEVTEFYIKKYQADTNYKQAYDSFMVGDYTSASIFIDKAVELYEEIDDRDSFPKCRLLREKIDWEFKEKNKREADSHYTQALNYYAMNDFEAALRKLGQARGIYVKLGDTKGVENCDALKANIEDEGRIQLILKADSYYSKAVTLSNFGNYSGAIELIDLAKGIYRQANHYNGTVQCDILTIRIADRNYRNALNAFQLKDFVKAISFAETARDLYTKAGYENMSQTAAELAIKSNESIGKPITKRETTTDYSYYVLGVLVLAFIVGSYMKMKRKPEPKRREEPGPSELEELEALERQGV